MLLTSSIFSLSFEFSTWVSATDDSRVLFSSLMESIVFLILLPEKLFPVPLRVGFAGGGGKSELSDLAMA